MSSINGSIASVTIALNPDPARFAMQLEVLSGQVQYVIAVDNGSTAPLAERFSSCATTNLSWVTLKQNVGIAAALNAGIAKARAVGASFVICMDHDSVPMPGCVAALCEALIELEQKGHRVAAVGPRICDQRDQHEAPFIKLGRFANQHQFCEPGAAPISTDFLITSGCFSRLSSYDVESGVGPLEEKLFIDSVDFEWCCRARSLGYQLFGVCTAALDHRLGDGRIRLVPGWSMIVHSPTRLYYMTRNRITLYRRGYVPARWKYKDLLRMLAKFTLTLLFLKPRATYLRASLEGVRDAFRQHLGERQ